MAGAYKILPVNTEYGWVDHEIDIAGTGLKYLDGSDIDLSVKIDSMDTTAVPLHPGGIIATPFSRLFITCNGDEIINFLIYTGTPFVVENPFKPGSVPNNSNLICEAAEQKYTIWTPSGRIKLLCLFARGGDVHYGWDANDSQDNFRTIPAGSSVILRIDDRNRPIYYASPVAGAVLEIEAWG